MRRCGRWLLCALLAAGISYGVYRGYGAWQKDHLTKQARTFFEKRDYRNAVLVARHLLQFDDRNTTACRVMAETAKLAGRPEAIAWFERLTQIEPKIDNQFSLASTALQFGQIKLCSDVISRIPETARDTSRWHQLAGAIALSKKESVVAENHFAAALRLAPGDPQIAVNLATVRLTSSEKEIVQNARQELARLSHESSVHLQALRALSADATAHKQHPQAEEWAEKSKADIGSNFADHLLYLEACQGTNCASAALEELKGMANSTPGTASELITWMNRHNLAGEALTWSKKLPPAVAQTQPVPLAIAESYSCAKDWNSLRAFVDGKNWANFESFRLAVASHAARRLSNSGRPPMESQTLWRSALKAAQSHSEHLTAIAQLAEGWGYKDQAEEAWWTIANGNDNPKAALNTLHRHYRAERNTYGLLRVAKRAYALNPADLIAANNCAGLGLLVQGDPSARRLAEKLHTEHPHNSAFAVTYAFALHTAGKTAEGLKILAGLKDDQLRVPAVAAYYVVMLVENGEMERARPFLNLAKQANLLPEEEQLLTAVSRKLIEAESNHTTKSVVHSS